MFEIPKTQERRVSAADVRGSHTGLGARGSPAPWSERTLVPAVQKTVLRLCNSAPGRRPGVHHVSPRASWAPRFPVLVLSFAQKVKIRLPCFLALAVMKIHVGTCVPPVACPARS